MRFMPMLFALVVAFAGGAAQAQKWDMPTPYSDNEFHTLKDRKSVV